MGFYVIVFSIYYGLWSVLGIYQYYFYKASQTLYLKDKDVNRYLQL